MRDAHGTTVSQGGKSTGVKHEYRRSRRCAAIRRPSRKLLPPIYVSLYRPPEWRIKFDGPEMVSRQRPRGRRSALDNPFWDPRTTPKGKVSQSTIADKEGREPRAGASGRFATRTGSTSWLAVFRACRLIGIGARDKSPGRFSERQIAWKSALSWVCRPVGVDVSVAGHQWPPKA